jgi:hypothetical protein
VNVGSSSKTARTRSRAGPQGKKGDGPPGEAVPSSMDPLGQMRVTVKLFVVSVRTSDVNTRVIGGEQAGENVAVPVTV